MSDRIFGLMGLVLSGFYLWVASTIPESFMSDVVGPRAFPYMVGAIIALCSFYFILRPDNEPNWPDLRDMGEILFAVAVLLLYAWLLPVFGFLITSVFVVFYLSWRLGTKPLMAFIVGILTSGGIYVVFRLILGLSLAKGPFGF